MPDLTSQQMRDALAVGATPQGNFNGYNKVGPLSDLRDAIASIPVPVPAISASGAGNGSALVSWSAVLGVAGYEIFRKDSHTGTWTLVGTSTGTQFPNTGLTPGRSYLYRVRSFDAAGNRSADSNYEIATTIDYTDPQLSTTIPVRARHIIDVRTAVNAICTYAGTAICPSLPFTGSALNEAQVQLETVKASDFTPVQSQIVSLRSAIAASPALFRETPATGMLIRGIHMEDLRSGAN